MVLRYILLFTSAFFLTANVGWVQTLTSGELLRTDSLIKAGESGLALPFLRDALTKPIAPETLRANVFMQYGICLIEKYETDSGINFLKQAAGIWQSRNDKANLFRAYSEMGNALSDQTDYRESVNFYKDALSNSVSANDSLTAYILLCALLLQKERFDSAYRIAQNNISKYRDDAGNPIPYKTYYTELALGEYLKFSGKALAAIPHLQKAAESFVTDDRYRSNAYMMLADTYREVKDYPNAFRSVESAEKFLGSDPGNDNLIELYTLYSELYEATGEFRKGLAYERESRKLSDSLYREKQAAIYTEAAEKYKNEVLAAQKEAVERNNQRIEAEKKVVEKNRNLFLIGMVFVALLAALFLRNARIRRKANLLLTQQKQQVQQLADQLAVANDTKARLFSTIGHDLRSPVSSLYASLKMQEIRAGGEDESMSEHTVQLLDALEDLLAWSKSQMDGFTVQKVKVSVRLLMEDLNAFYASAALAKGITLVNEAKEKIVLQTDENILKTILRNVISNAISHTEPGYNVRLSSGQEANGVVNIRVSNPCSPESFQRFQSSYRQVSVHSGVHGLGTVLIKEFAQKISAAVRLHYTDGEAVVNLSL